MSTLLCSMLLLAAGQPQPRLHFGPADLPGLRDRCRADTLYWPRIQAEADALLQPGAFDLEAVAAAAQAQKQSVRGHFYGRRLIAWLEPLGFAYQITGDARYGTLGARILVDAARRLPPDAPPVGPGAFAGARGDILRALASGYDWLAPCLTPEERAEVTAAMAAYVRSILDEAARKPWWVPHHNFVGVAVGAAGRASLLLEDAYPKEAPRWREQAAALVSQWLKEGFDEKGAGLEGVLYAFYGLENGTLFADALKRAGGPDLFARYRPVSRFLACSLLPGEAVYDAQNDSNYAGNGSATLLRLAGAGDGLARWLWERSGGPQGVSPYHILFANDTRPVSPEQAGVGWAEHFPGRGLAVFRTGWGRDDLMLSLESGPYHATTHNQADKCQVTLYGLGGRWLIDSGYGNNQEPEGRAQTVAHSLILVDGKGQALSGAGLGTDGEILQFAADETHGYVLGDATEAYQRNSAGKPGVALQQAQRHALFLRPRAGRPAYALLVDVMRVDGEPHAFDWLLHTDARNTVELGAGRAVLRDAGGPSGGAYVETPLGSEAKGRISFPVALPRAGRYRVWARVRASLPEPAKSDSFLVQWDDREPVAWHAPTSTEWIWGAVRTFEATEPLAADLAAGAHRLSFLTREAGAAIDRLVVTDDPAWDPGAGTPPPPGALAMEAEAAAEVVAPMAVRKEDGPAPAECLVQWLAPEGTQLSRDTYDGHPRLHARVTATAPVFATLLYPHRPGAPQPRATCTREDGRLAVTVSWPDGTDRAEFTLDGSAAVETTRQAEPSGRGGKAG